MESSRRDTQSQRFSASQSALFDYKRSLARLGGDPSLFQEIAVLFLEDSPRLLEQARQGLDSQDLESLARAAHSLKNLSASFDAEALVQAAATLERHAENGEFDQAAACFAALERELERLQAALSRLPNTSRAR